MGGLHLFEITQFSFNFFSGFCAEFFDERLSVRAATKGDFRCPFVYTFLKDRTFAVVWGRPHKRILPPFSEVSGKEKQETYLETIWASSKPSKPACFPRRDFLFKRKKTRETLDVQAFHVFLLEAPPRLELGNKDFADLRLTTWLWRRKKWSGRRGSDSRPPPWQGGALPTELLPHTMVPWGGIEPPTL